jgi:two-component system, cell cycle sensor histidine kinase and response regulator CckA
VGIILANTKLAQQKLPRKSAADEEIRHIQQVAGRAADIVRQMMAYAGHETAALEPVDLSRLVGDMLQLLQISISKKVTLKMDLQQNLPAVLGNPAQIQQVIMNLITNASEAIGERGGVVTIATSEVQVEGGSSANVQGLRSGVWLCVSDTGCGMTEEIRARIFDPFFTTKFAGRGLGLAAVHGIVRSHGGTISVISALGHGSRFEILLPRAAQPASEAGDSGAPAANEGGSFAGKVLVVEDEKALRSAVSEMLRRTGCTVIEAGDGETGINYFRTGAQKIDVVLLDLTLPGMSGTEVLGELRRIRPDVKVILTSAYSPDLVQDAVDNRKPLMYLRKPYVFRQLMGLIQAVSAGQ